MFEFSGSKDMRKKKDIIREVAVRKVAVHLCLTIIVKELKINVEHGRLVTLYIIFCVGYEMLFNVAKFFSPKHYHVDELGRGTHRAMAELVGDTFMLEQ